MFFKRKLNSLYKVQTEKNIIIPYLFPLGQKLLPEAPRKEIDR